MQFPVAPTARPGPAPHACQARCQVRRVRGLDALRGVAATGVMLFHFTWWTDPAHPGVHRAHLAFVFPLGDFGVQLFFIISGFVILMTLERTRGVHDFVVSRLSRLYPAFLACFAVTALVARFSGVGWKGVYGMMLAANLTMVPTALGFPMLDPSYWSLLPEIVFYALAAAVCCAVGLRHVERASLLWLAGALAMRLYGLERLPGRLVVLTDAEFCHLFVIGMMLYRLRGGSVTRLTVPVLLVALGLSAFGPHWSPMPIDPVAYTALIAGFALAVGVATRLRLRLLEAGLLPFLGDVSYPLYLVHQIAGRAVIVRLEAAGVDANIAVAVAVLLAVVVATAISRTVEKPGQRLLRRLLLRGPIRLPAGRLLHAE
jgi:peptidoglycan/LPS O-acetylase OafA/YrhL